MNTFATIHIWDVLWKLFLGKIKELFSKDSINSETVLVLVNAVYFKAKWEKYFDCENTVDAVFSLSEVPEHCFLDIHSEFPPNDGQYVYSHLNLGRWVTTGVYKSIWLLMKISA